MSTIKINGKTYETFTDEDGVLRFKPNNLIINIRIRLKTSDVIEMYELGSLSLMDVLDWYAGMGFAICDVRELSFFEDFEFEQEEQPITGIMEKTFEQFIDERFSDLFNKVGKNHAIENKVVYLNEMVALVKEWQTNNNTKKDNNGTNTSHN